MKQLMGILAIMLLVLTACSTGSTQTITTKEEAGKAPTGTVANNAGDDRTAMLAKVEQETIAKNIKTQELVVPVNYGSGSVGDDVIFGVNLNQLNKGSVNAYFAKIEFVEGRDKNSNKIEVNKDTMKSWLVESETNAFSLAVGESKFLPVIVNIKSEIKPGVETIPGSYRFDIQFYERIQNDFDKKLDKLVKSVYVKVE